MDYKKLKLDFEYDSFDKAMEIHKKLFKYLNEYKVLPYVIALDILEQTDSIKSYSTEHYDYGWTSLMYCNIESINKKNGKKCAIIHMPELIKLTNNVKKDIIINNFKNNKYSNKTISSNNNLLFVLSKNNKIIVIDSPLKNLSSLYNANIKNNNDYLYVNKYIINTDLDDNHKVKSITKLYYNDINFLFYLFISLIENGYIIYEIDDVANIYFWKIIYNNCKKSNDIIKQHNNALYKYYNYLIDNNITINKLKNIDMPSYEINNLYDVRNDILKKEYEMHEKKLIMSKDKINKKYIISSDGEQYETYLSPKEIEKADEYIETLEKHIMNLENEILKNKGEDKIWKA